MTTTTTTVHVYQLSQRLYAAYRGHRPHVRPPRLRCEGERLAWRGWRRVTPMAPLVVSVVLEGEPDDATIRREIAFVALTEWSSADVDIAIDTRIDALSSRATPLSEAELEAARARADAEAALDAATTLDIEAAIAWLDGDRSALPAMLALATAACVRSFGVYMGIDEILDTIIIAPPLPDPDLPAHRAPDRSRRTQMEWPGVPQSSISIAVERGLARFTDMLEHQLELTPAGRMAAVMRTETGRLALLLHRLQEGPLHKETRRSYQVDSTIRSAWTASSSCRWSPSGDMPLATSSYMGSVEVMQDDRDRYNAAPSLDTSEDGGDMLRRMLAMYDAERLGL